MGALRPASQSPFDSMTVIIEEVFLCTMLITSMWVADSQSFHVTFTVSST